jgi:hypothetical protein
VHLRSFGYPVRVGLLACPFCREMFEEGEAKACPVCGMELTKFEKLPISLDAIHEEGEVPLAPEREKLPWTFLGRSRGPLVLLGIAGAILFFLPWVRLTMPYIDTKSGFDLAHQRIGWLWAAFVGWTVLIPTVMSRRSIVQLRGARVAAAFLSAIPAVSVGILLARPPRGGLIPVHYTWDWPMYGMLAVSLLAILCAVRLGGQINDIRVARGSSRGQDLH